MGQRLLNKYGAIGGVNTSPLSVEVHELILRISKTLRTFIDGKDFTPVELRIIQAYMAQIVDLEVAEQVLRYAMEKREEEREHR